MGILLRCVALCNLCIADWINCDTSNLSCCSRIRKKYTVRHSQSAFHRCFILLLLDPRARVSWPLSRTVLPCPIVSRSYSRPNFSCPVPVQPGKTSRPLCRPRRPPPPPPFTGVHLIQSRLTISRNSDHVTSYLVFACALHLGAHLVYVVLIICYGRKSIAGAASRPPCYWEGFVGLFLHVLVRHPSFLVFGPSRHVRCPVTCPHPRNDDSSTKITRRCPQSLDISPRGWNDWCIRLFNTVQSPSTRL